MNLDERIEAARKQFHLPLDTNVYVSLTDVGARNILQAAVPELFDGAHKIVPRKASMHQLHMAYVEVGVHDDQHNAALYEAMIEASP